MTVGEMIEALKQFPADMRVVCAFGPEDDFCDAELETLRVSVATWDAMRYERARPGEPDFDVVRIT